MSPIISVVLPTYNGSKYISRSIDSVLNQSFSDIELIIVNDCSTDNTLEIISKYASLDKRIKIINNLKNMKLPASLNIGFRHANGKYLTWTSDDNIYKPNAFSVMYNYLEDHENIDFVSCNMDWVTENGEFIGKHSDWGDRSTPLTLAWVCNVGACFLYKKEILKLVGEYDESIFCAEDYDYWCRIALTRNMKYLKDNLYTYVSNKKSLSYTHRNLADEMGDFVRHKYANLIIAKYANNYIDACVTYGRLKSKYPYFKSIPNFMCLGIFIFYIIPKFLTKFLPLKKWRHTLRDKLNGLNQDY